MGRNNVLNEWRPVIQCEVLHAHRASELESNSCHKAALMDLLSQCGYIVYLCCLSADGRHLQSLEEIPEFPSLVYADPPHTCDYVILPQELRLQLMGAS